MSVRMESEEYSVVRDATAAAEDDDDDDNNNADRNNNGGEETGNIDMNESGSIVVGAVVSLVGDDIPVVDSDDDEDTESITIDVTTTAPLATSTTRRPQLLSGQPLQENTTSSSSSSTTSNNTTTTTTSTTSRRRRRNSSNEQQHDIPVARRRRTSSETENATAAATSQNDNHDHHPTTITTTTATTSTTEMVNERNALQWNINSDDDDDANSLPSNSIQTFSSDFREWIDLEQGDGAFLGRDTTARDENDRTVHQHDAELLTEDTNAPPSNGPCWYRTLIHIHRYLCWMVCFPPMILFLVFFFFFVVVPSITLIVLMYYCCAANPLSPVRLWWAISTSTPPPPPISTTSDYIPSDPSGFLMANSNTMGGRMLRPLAPGASSPSSPPHSWMMTMMMMAPTPTEIQNLMLYQQYVVERIPRLSSNESSSSSLQTPNDLDEEAWKRVPHRRHPITTSTTSTTTTTTTTTTASSMYWFHTTQESLLLQTISSDRHRNDLTSTTVLSNVVDPVAVPDTSGGTNTNTTSLPEEDRIPLPSDILRVTNRTSSITTNTTTPTTRVAVGGESLERVRDNNDTNRRFDRSPQRRQQQISSFASLEIEANNNDDDDDDSRSSTDSSDYHHSYYTSTSRRVTVMSSPIITTTTTDNGVVYEDEEMANQTNIDITTMAVTASTNNISIMPPRGRNEEDHPIRVRRTVTPTLSSETAMTVRNPIRTDQDRNIINRDHSRNHCVAITQSYPRIRDATCEICLLEYQPGDVVALSNNNKCTHAFHLDCITQWLMRKSTCPSCRREYLEYSE